MKIALVNHEVQLGGAEVALLRLAEGLRESFDLTATLPGDGPLTEGLARRGVHVEIVPMPARSLAARRGESWRTMATLLGDARLWTRSVRALAARVRRADLVLTGSTKSHLYGGLAGRIAGRPVVWWLHDTVDRTTFGPAIRTLVRTAARRMPHRIVAVSRAAGASLGLPEGDPRLRVIYNGVRVRADSARTRASDPVPRVGWIGRLIPSKGPDVFVDVAAALASEVPGVEFVIVGAVDPRNEPFADEVRRRVRERGLDSRVEILGYRDDLGAVFDRLSALAFTSVASDSLPTVVLEAMASGVPVVAFSGGGVAEIVEEGRTGCLVDPGEVGAMVGRLAGLLRSPAERARLGEAGRTRAEETFGWDRWIAAWREELLNLMGGVWVE